MLESLFNKIAGFRPATLLKRDSNTFSYEMYEIFKNTYFEEHLRMTASDTIHILMQYTNNIYEHDTIKYYIAYKLNTKLFYFGRLYAQLLKIMS